ncbi:MAG: class B sortase [Oscillospiraceae bacterium]|nr:class B sortase [Oscillospiraceae bacterium]
MKKFVFLGIVLALFGVIAYSSYQLIDINRSTAQETELHNRLIQYRTAPQQLASDTQLGDSIVELSMSTEIEPVPFVDQSILNLQASFQDVVGWIEIPNTRVYYPFAQGDDNDHYLYYDLEQNRSAAGTIFMDYRNSDEFTDFNTIIHGHHMRSGSMFATLQQFNNQAFFDNNDSATIYLLNATYQIEFMAFAVIQPDDMIIYNPMITSAADKIEFLDYVRNIARYYRDIGVMANNRIVTLSTCNYEFSNARMVLIGRLRPTEI